MPSKRFCAISTQPSYVSTLCVEFALIVSLQKKGENIFAQLRKKMFCLITHNFAT